MLGYKIVIVIVAGVQMVLMMDIGVVVVVGCGDGWWYCQG